MRVLAVTNMYPTVNVSDSGSFVEQQIRSLRHIGIYVELLFVDRVGQGVAAYRALGKSVRLRTAEFEPDIIHVMYGGVMADVITRSVSNTPVVVSFCGTDLLGGPFLSFFRRATVYYGVLASYRAARRANGIIIKSKNLGNCLPSNIDQSKVWVIPNGIDLDRFKPLDTVECRRNLGWNSDAFHVLFPSYANHSRKRFDLALSAVAELKCRGLPVELHQLYGRAHEEVPLWLNASDVLLLTSIHEGSPNIVKEALACNRAVVSVDVGDVAERMEGIAGCYLAQPNPRELAAKLQLVLNGSLRVNGRVKMQELSLERVARQLNEVYMTVLDLARTGASREANILNNVGGSEAFSTKTF